MYKFTYDYVSRFLLGSQLQRVSGFAGRHSGVPLSDYPEALDQHSEANRRVQ